MSWKQSDKAVYYFMPPLRTIEVPQKARMGLFVESCTSNKGINYTCTLPCFNPVYDEKYFIEIFNKGETPFEFKATPNQKWIKLSKSEGEVTKQQRIFVSIDWPPVPQQEMLKGQIQIQGADSEETFYVNYFNPAAPAKNELKGMFVEKDGVISISAANYTRKVDSAGISWQVVDDLELTGKLVTMSPATADPIYTFDPNTPHLEYDIYTYNYGVVEVHSFVLPVFTINSFRNAEYAISIDDGRPQSINIGVPENSAQWKENIRRNTSKNITRHYIDKPGRHTLKIWMVDTSMAFDKIIIDLGGLKMSYLSPEETRIR